MEARRARPTLCLKGREVGLGQALSIATRMSLAAGRELQARTRVVVLDEL